MSDTVRDLIIDRGTDAQSADRIFLQYEDVRLTYAEYLQECSRYAHLFLAHRKPGPFHVGIMMQNYPEFLCAWGGAALSGAVLVGINYTYFGEPLCRDINYTDCQLLLTEPQYVDTVADVLDGCEGVAPANVLVTTRGSDGSADEPHPGWRWLQDRLDDVCDDLGDASMQPPDVVVGADDNLMVVFTSGTTGAPKGILCSHKKYCWVGLIAMRLDFTPDDVAYFSQPLFHSNSHFLGVMPALTAGAGVAFRPKFSSHNWLNDIRRYRATSCSYVGKPLSYLLEIPPTAHDRDHRLRVLIGNGASTATRRAFVERYGVDEVVELYGATEGAISTFRRPDDPPDSVGWAPDDVRIFHEDGTECPNGELNTQENLTNAAECVGQIVRVGSVGSFEGYYKNEQATNDKVRDGNYWSGDLGHIEVHEKDGEPMRFLFFDGRTSDWIRYNGENFPTEPIEWLIEAHGPVSACVVYGVPNPHGDDDVMAGLVLQPGVEFDPEAFWTYLDAHPNYLDLWVPQYVRILADPPWTPTHKLRKNPVQTEQFNPEQITDPLWCRRDGGYVPFDSPLWTEVRALFAEKGRTRILH